MKKTIGLLISLIGLVGCFASAPPKNYFQLHVGKAAVSTGVIDRIVLVENVQTEDLYDDFRIIYRESLYEINYYSYDFWAENPGRLVKKSLVDYFKLNGTFSRILSDIAEGDPDLIFRTRLDAIEEIDDAASWSARLAMELSVVDFKSGETLHRREFDRTERMAAQSVSQLPVTLSKILEDELTAFIQDLIRRLEKKGRSS